MANDSIRMRAAIVLRLIDGVTGLPCGKRGFSISCPSWLRPERKRAGGLIVLVHVDRPQALRDMDREPAIVTIASPEFQPYAVEVPEPLDAQVRTCVLFPTRAYAPEGPTCCIEGMASPRAHIRVVDRTRPLQIFAAEDIAAGAQEVALLSDHVPIPAAIALTDGEHEHVTRLVPDPDRANAYELLSPPPRAFPRKRLAVFTVWDTRADEDGSFALFLDRAHTFPAAGELEVVCPDGASRRRPFSISQRGGRIWCDMGM